MTSPPDSPTFIDVSRLFLDDANPRHKPFQTQAEVIAYLCQSEKVLPLARDIAANGLNPLELFAVVACGDNAFFAAEGNRRLCALKLLNDPQLAPSSLRKEFAALGQAGPAVLSIPAIVFSNREAVDLWLNRIHAGSGDGRGRRPWTAEQKARHSGYGKNVRAQMLLDVGEGYGLINKTERSGRISTVQRYVQNPAFRGALGLDVRDAGNPTTTLAEPDFKNRLATFLKDLVSKQITTRDNVPDIRLYAAQLQSGTPLTTVQVEPRPIDPSSAVRPADGIKKPRAPRLPRKIASSEAMEEALAAIPSYKLQKLYFSVCSIALSAHTPLLTVGAWTLLESLTALHGRKSSTDFYGYLSPVRLTELGLGDGKALKGLRAAIKRISDLGNITKHEATAASFNGETLANDMEPCAKCWCPWQVAQRIGSVPKSRGRWRDTYSFTVEVSWRQIRHVPTSIAYLAI